MSIQAKKDKCTSDDKVSIIMSFQVKKDKSNEKSQYYERPPISVQVKKDKCTSGNKAPII